MRVAEFNSRLKPLLQANYLSVLSRVIAGIVGGYILANCLSILLAYMLPIPKADGVLLGIQVSFTIYTAAVMWVFAAKTAFKAWLGLLVPGVASAVILYFLMPEGLL